MQRQADPDGDQQPGDRSDATSGAGLKDTPPLAPRGKLTQASKFSLPHNLFSIMYGLGLYEDGDRFQ